MVIIRPQLQLILLKILSSFLLSSLPSEVSICSRRTLIATSSLLSSFVSNRNLVLDPNESINFEVGSELLILFVCAGIRPNAVRPGRGVPVVPARGLGRKRQGRRLLTTAVQRPYRRTLLLHINREPARPVGGRARRHSTTPKQSISVIELYFFT